MTIGVMVTMIMALLVGMSHELYTVISYNNIVIGIVMTKEVWIIAAMVTMTLFHWTWAGALNSYSCFCWFFTTILLFNLFLVLPWLRSHPLGFVSISSPGWTTLFGTCASKMWSQSRKRRTGPAGSGVHIMIHQWNSIKFNSYALQCILLFLICL